MESIYKSPLFTGLPPQETDALLQGKSRIQHYPAGEIVAIQGTPYKTLLIIGKGIVRGEMNNPAGDRIVIEEITAPRSIAPAFLYATDNTLPVDVIAVTDVVIVGIPVENFTAMLQKDSRVLTNFMRSMSDRSKFLSDRVRLLRFGTIRNKIAHYLLRQMQQTDSEQFTLPHTHQELADLFGVTRPALSRIFSQLNKEGIVLTQKNHIRISDRQRLIGMTL